MTEGMRVSFSERGARGNPWVESLWGRMKTEIGSRIHQACDLKALKSIPMYPTKLAEARVGA